MEASDPAPSATPVARRRRIGAEVVEGGVHFRVWAPSRRKVRVLIAGVEHLLAREDDGHHSGFVSGAADGALYQYALDRDPTPYPDPASRFQPDGPHGPSMVVDPTRYRWKHDRLDGLGRKGLVIQEIHVGTFTPEGTYRGAIEKLPLLRDVGINVIEIMPLAEFPGQFGWGYDGVALWAPFHRYGSPDDLRAFVDRAHELEISVILDVVYNHFGPDGCYVAQFTPHYFKEHQTEWGAAVNFDGEESAGVREFVSENAAYWIDEFHFDGLRLDATQSIHDNSRPHVLKTIGEAARAAAGKRSLYIVAENEPQDVALVEEHGIDALWNDDWHHAAGVALSGFREAYYTDYAGTPQEFLSMARLGFLYQGQYYSWQKDIRGTPSAHLEADRFVCFLDNHDQVANTRHGERIHQRTSGGRYRAMTALLLLQPQTPMLFQGQEFAASAHFFYFADHEEELAAKVREGRHEFLRQFPSMADPRVAATLPAPEAESTFAACRLDWEERDRHEEIVRLHRDLLAMRREQFAFSAQSARQMEGAVLSDQAFLLRWFIGGEDDRLLIVNLGERFDITIPDEPQLAPPKDFTWEVLWVSEHPNYGGKDVGPIVQRDAWRIPAQATAVFKPVRRD